MVYRWRLLTISHCTCVRTVFVYFKLLLNQCLLACFLTGAVGLPLPGVEVRIVMNNTTNTTIVEGNCREIQVINKCTLCSTIYIMDCVCIPVMIRSFWGETSWQSSDYLCRCSLSHVTYQQNKQGGYSQSNLCASNQAAVFYLGKN